MRSLARKLTGRKGFTLGETMVAILILLLATGVIAGAIPAASRAYIKAVDAANAQVLLSTAVTVLRDELSTASDISVTLPVEPAEPVEGEAAADPQLIIQYKSNNNGWSRIVCTQSGDKAGIEIWYKKSEEEDYQFNRKLVSDKASTGNLYVTIGSAATTSADVISITGISVTLKGNDTVQASSDLTVRSVG